jgi:thiamine transport system ATP-binding protein
MLTIDRCRLSWPDFEADYTLEVETGAFCAVVGPSGGGKTTLLHMLAGFEQPVSGTLFFRGVDLLPLPPAQRPVAMVFQDHNLFPHLTALQNAALGLRPSLKISAAERDTVVGALEAVGLMGLEERKPGALSGGQRQRVALARALVAQKPLLLLDEPLASLDPELRQDMVGLINELRHRTGATIIMTLHTPTDVMGVADKMAFIASGRVIAAGEPSQVLDRMGRTRAAYP